jgi:hypothetical protein
MPRQLKKSAFLVALFLGLAAGGFVILNRTPGSPYPRYEDTELINDTESANLDSVKTYRDKVVGALEGTPPLLQVNEPSAEQQQALAVLAKHPRLHNLTQDKDSNAYRLEVMQSYKLPDGQAINVLEACKKEPCYRLDLFNFSLNEAVVAVVNLKTETVLSVEGSDTQPELPASLTRIAEDIAKNHSAVKAKIGGGHEPIMSSTKTALKKTVCDRSNHLCVAPTFVLADQKKALWTIVDLTDLQLVGLTWTTWGDKPAEPITERQLKTEAIDKTLCGKVVNEQRGDWRFSYTLTGSDGLEIRDVTYKNQPVIASAKNVDWHVSYSRRDNFGYSDAVGCPVFSTAAVIPADLPQVKEEDGRVVLEIDFEGEKWPQPCNYYYRQRFEMNRDGSFRPVVANVGRGCGDYGTYRPVTRIQLPAGVKDLKRGQSDADKEQWWQPDKCPTKESCPTLSYAAGDTDYEVIPGHGQFNDGGLGDNPFLYLTAVHKDKPEGQDDLLTIGPCCNTDYKQGPEKYLNDESLTDGSVALWYVAQLKNNGTPGQEYCWAGSKLENGEYKESEWPCPSGPLIRPKGR